LLNGTPQLLSFLEAALYEGKAVTAWTILKQTFDEWLDDKAPQLGASLAFYSALSLAPLLVIGLGFAALIFDRETATHDVVQELRSLVGDDGAKAISDMIQNAAQPNVGVLATFLSTVTLLLGASGVFGQLQDAMNTIWGVKPKEGRGIWGLIKDRFLSFTMVLGVAFLLLISLILSAALAAIGITTERVSPLMQWVAQGANMLVSFTVITALFAMIFKVLPDVQIAWRNVWLGAVITAALFTVGKFGIGLYLGHSALSSAYGVAGSFVVLLVWTYYSAQILFFGAEFTQV